MSNSIDRYILSKLNSRKEQNNYRTLNVLHGLVDFFSNDYLGFAKSHELKHRLQQELNRVESAPLGSTGSRLLSGNSQYAEDLEKLIAEFHGAEAALIFNSGFDANYGLLSALPYKGDTIIYDELIHASAHDGMRNSKATAVSFLHNNIDSLEQKLRLASGLKYIVVESVYSMDGDLAPLREIVELCKKYEAGLIIDEAHATGIFGAKGEGVYSSLFSEACTQTPEFIIRIHTFGKALGVHGAVVLCSENTRNFLINFCRPFIFSTALPQHTLAAIKCAYEFLPEAGNQREMLFNLVKHFREECQKAKLKHTQLMNGDSPVQSVLVTGNSRAKEMAKKIQQKGFDVRAILFPTVPKGMERIRICLHSFNTEEEVTNLVHAIVNSEA